MAGPYASLTSPYAPNHMDSVFRISDLIAQQGRSAAQAQYAKRMMVGDLVGGIGNTVGNIFARRDQQQQQAAEAQVLADLFSSGKPVDLPTLVQKLGIDRAKAIYPLLEAEMTKREARAKEAEAARAKQNEVGLRQRAAGALQQGADPRAVAIEQWGEGGPALPAGLLADPAQKKLDAKNALLAQAAEALKHGMSRVEAQQWYGAQTGGESLPKEWFPEAPPKVERKLITVPGPGGVPTQRYATEEELEKGVEIYRAPTASGSGAADGIKLTGAQQEDLATMDTVVDLVGLATEIGDRNGWKGVGTLFTGTVSSMLADLGWGTEDEENLRNYVGNIQGTIAKLRGGTAFSKQEKAMLDSYTPTIDDGDLRIKSKLKGLVAFIEKKKANTLKYASEAGRAAATTPPPGAAIPDGVTRALANEPANPPPMTPYVLADGSKWRKNTDGSIQRVP